MNETNLSVIDGVCVSADENGVIRFTPSVEKNEPERNVEDQERAGRSWLGRLYDWWTNAVIRPYVKTRNSADPFKDRSDPDAGLDGKTAVEAGIQIRF